MEKHEHKQLMDLLVTMKQAQELKRYGDCQEAALFICDFIESVEGNGTKTVTLLENYCEMLFAANNGDISTKLLNKHLVKIENSIKYEIKTKTEIAFISHKAGMSDSLESIYLAAEADPECDAYWIPVPYYNLNTDGSFGEMLYEGADCYGSEIKVTDWQTYDIEKRHPDVIFTFNPYDNNNTITSIHPDFYCEKLRNFTSLLVYVPYFVLVGKVPEKFCTVPGCIYADKTILQSEVIRNTWAEVFKNNYGDKLGNLADKFVALGCPKFDKALNTKREDFRLPHKWSNLIGNKKVILYNTTLGPLLNGNEQYLKKICHVLETFQARNDIVLWWRPHPISEAAYATMRPHLSNLYRRIVNIYESGDWGIYDDTPFLHRAIAYSDAYYGDGGGSLVPVYQITGKPIMTSNTSIISTSTSEIPIEKLFALNTNAKDSIIRGHYRESEKIHLNDYINYVLRDVNYESFAEYRASLVKSMNVNTDGTAGEKIYAYVKNIATQFQQEAR